MQMAIARQRFSASSTRHIICSCLHSFTWDLQARLLLEIRHVPNDRRSIPTFRLPLRDGGVGSSGGIEMVVEAWTASPTILETGSTDRQHLSRGEFRSHGTFGPFQNSVAWPRARFCGQH